MTVNHLGVKRLIVNYNKISMSFQNDGTKPNCNKIFQVTTGQFNKNKGYEKTIEETLMRDLDLYSSEEIPKAKGCIIIIVTTRNDKMVNK